MAISDTHIVITFIASGIVALGIVIVAMMTAPSFAVGIGRIRLMLKIGGRTVIVLGVITGVGMLGWGVVSRSEGLMYFSMLPLVAAILTSNFMRRSGIS
jgi:hypothetical protein